MARSDLKNPLSLEGGETESSRMSGGHSRRRTGAHDFVRPGGNIGGEGDKSETIQHGDARQGNNSEPPRHGVLPQVIANPHYQLIGGENAVRRLVDRFYALMDELPEARTIRALHPGDLSHAKERLFMFLSGWLGGPQLYAERFGHPRLRHKHQAFPIGEAERDAWMLCMTRALDELVPEAALRAQLTQSFFKTADFLRNI